MTGGFIKKNGLFLLQIFIFTFYQEQESTKERLISAGADYERQEEKYSCEIERLQDKLAKVKIQWDRK